MATYVFDIDGTICLGYPYENCIPIKNRIELINKLYMEGATIVFFTARGMGSSGNNVIEATNKWYELTKRQLREWGVSYHSLVFGKPAGDFYVDDKGVFAAEFFNE